MKSETPQARRAHAFGSGDAHMAQPCEAAPAACGHQNRMHVQKALMEYLLLGRIG